MKKSLFILCLLITKEGNSQILRNDLAIRFDDRHFDVRIKKNKTFSMGYTNNVSANIIRDFMERFEHATSVRWSVDEKEVTAFFNYEDENITLLYKNDGDLILTRKNYDSTRLSPGIAAFLKQELGTPFIVDQVTEVIKDRQTIFEISMQNEKHWLIVQICINNEDERLMIIDKKLLTKFDKNIK